LRRPRRSDPVLALILAALAAGCAPQSRSPFQQVSFADLPGWHDDDIAAALHPLRRSCAKPADDMRAACAALAQVAPGEARRYFEHWFVPHRVSDALITGYYEPELHGARAPSARYRVPLYRAPSPPVASTRAEIDRGALRGRDLELVWVDDPIDAFFLHIQGSGRVRLEDGSVLRLGYAGNNGRPYTAIGAELVRDGAMPLADVTMQSIRAWLATHPSEAPAMMARNERYVFFRVVPEGPVGSQGVTLEPGRSIAVDPQHLPLGAPVFVTTSDPLDATRPLRRLTVTQDTGSAIKGLARADFFWGAGADAGDRAGKMKGRGELYLLKPRTAPGVPTS
jgi:membrane-bound lytic murein transglycosylase A